VKKGKKEPPSVNIYVSHIETIKAVSFGLENKVKQRFGFLNVLFLYLFLSFSLSCQLYIYIQSVHFFMGFVAEINGVLE